MKYLDIDLMPDYIPFLVQCSNGLGEKTDPSSAKLTIYQETGNDNVFSSVQIPESPFTLEKINDSIGLWGVLIPKTSFAKGNFYLALWEMTIDGTDSVKVERYFAKGENAEKIVFSYLLLDERNNRAIPQANVEVSTDRNANEIIFRGQTDRNGYMKFEIKLSELPDKLYFWRKKRNYKFNDPEEQSLFNLTGYGKNISTSNGRGRIH